MLMMHHRRRGSRRHHLLLVSLRRSVGMWLELVTLGHSRSLVSNFRFDLAVLIVALKISIGLYPRIPTEVYSSTSRFSEEK